MSNFGKGFRQPQAPANKTEALREQSELVEQLVAKVNEHVGQLRFLGQMTSQLFNQTRQMSPEVSALSSLAASNLVDRPAKENDFVMIDYLGVLVDEAGNPEKDEDGLPKFFDGGYGSRYVILGLTGGSLVPGFEEQLVGKSAGEEVDVKVTFPENYHSKDLAGKKALFKVVVHSIREPIGQSSVDKAKMENDIAKANIRAAKAAEAKAKAEAEKAAAEAAKPKLEVVPDLAPEAPAAEAAPSSGSETPQQ